MTRHRGLIVTVVTFALLMGIACIWLVNAWVERRSVLKTTELRLVELAAKLARSEEIEAIKQTVSAAPDPRTGLFIAGEKEAASRFEVAFRSLAQEHGVEVLSFVPATSKLEGNVPVVSARVNLLVGDRRLGPFVKSLEDGPPVVFLDHFKVSSRSNSMDESEDLMLEISATLTVYRDVPIVERSLP